MRTTLSIAALFAAALSLSAAGDDGLSAVSPPLGLPPVSYPADNPQTPEKIALGEKLFNDKRFSSTGDVNCAHCHKAEAAFTDGPLKVSEGINKLTGTRNAPTVINSAYFETAFWDGRSPSLEDQALHPFVNPIEMGLKDHQPILDIVRSDPEYVGAFQEVFGKQGEAVTMGEVTKAIAAFERTIISGNSPFDRWYYGKEEGALSEQQKRGFELFVNQGRCVSCHLIEQTQALFTDNRFHNVGQGINDLHEETAGLAREFVKAQLSMAEVDIQVLSDKRTSELGRLAVTKSMEDIGSFKTPTLRNVAVTAPYMHDGALASLRDVVVHYNNGGVNKKGEPVNDFLSGGIRPLNLTDAQVDDLVAFLESLTSPEYAPLAAVHAEKKKEN